eukprot:Rmarinus@m.23256
MKLCSSQSLAGWRRFLGAWSIILSLSFFGIANAEVTPPPAVGGGGYALMCDGMSQGIRIQDFEGFPSKAGTLAMWTRASSISPFHFLFSYMSNAEHSVGDLWELGYEWFLYAELYSFNSAMTLEELIAEGIIPLAGEPGTWHHIAATFDMDRHLLMVYKDGELARNQTAENPAQLLPVLSYGTLYIALESDHATQGVFEERQSFAGLIDEVKMYNRSLSSEEIKLEMHRTNTSFAEDLVMYFSFDQVYKANWVYDLTGNGHNGEFIGTTAKLTSTSWVELAYPSQVFELDDLVEGFGPIVVPSDAPVYGSEKTVYTVPGSGMSTIQLMFDSEDSYDDLQWVLEDLPILGQLYQTSNGISPTDEITMAPAVVTHSKGLLVVDCNATCFESLEDDTEGQLLSFDYSVSANTGNGVETLGRSHATILRNRPPTTTSLVYPCSEDADLMITFPAEDLDGDFTTVVITELPHNGTFLQLRVTFPIYPFDEIPEMGDVHRIFPDQETGDRDLYFPPNSVGDPVTQTPFRVPDIGRRLIYRPSLEDSQELYDSFSFYIEDDNGLRSDETTSYVSVFAVNDIPQAYAVNLTMEEDGGAIPFTLVGTDIETTFLRYIIESVPDNARVTSADGEEIFLKEPVVELTEWASDVISLEGVVVGVTGAPDCYPSYGYCPKSWGSPNPNVWTVFYAEPLYATQVLIYEVAGPGGVYKIQLHRQGAAEEAYTTVYIGEPVDAEPYASSRTARVFSPVICPVDYPVDRVRLFIDPTLLSDDYFVDAIGLVGMSTTSLVLYESPDFFFEPDPDAFGTFEIVYSVSDCSDSSLAQAVEIVVTPVNDAPTIPTEEFLFEQGEARAVTLGVYDAEGDDIFVYVAEIQSQGEFSVSVYAEEGNEFVLIDPQTLSEAPVLARNATLLIQSSRTMPCGLAFPISISADDGQAASSGEIYVSCLITGADPFLYIGGLFSLTAYDTEGLRVPNEHGVANMAGFLMAVDEINNKTDGVLDNVLPQTQIVYGIRDTERDTNKAYIEASSLITDPHYSSGSQVSLIALVGARYSTTSEAVQAVASAYSQMQVSYASTSAELSDFSWFLRTCTSDALQLHVIADFVQSMGWDRVSTLSTDDTYGSSIDIFHRLAEEYGISIIEQLTYIGEEESTADALLHLSQAGTRVNVIFGSYWDSLYLIDLLAPYGLTGNGYTYVTGDGIGLSVLNATVSPGFLGVEPMAPQVNESRADDPLMIRNFNDRWMARKNINGTCIDPEHDCMCADAVDADGAYIWRYDHDNNATTPDRCLGFQHTEAYDAYVPFTYDAVLTVVLALNKLYSQYEFNVEGADLMNLYKQGLGIDGVTGYIHFSGTDRDTDNFFVVESLHKDGEIRQIATWSSTTAELTFECDVRDPQCVTWTTPDNSIPSSGCVDNDYYQEVFANRRCLACASELHSYNPDMTNCTVCGYETCPQDGCSPGTYYDFDLEMCTPCPPGYYSSLPGQSECTPCPPGKYSAVYSTIECSTCSAGDYQDEAGQPSCESCPTNTYQREGSGISVEDCVCLVGYYSPNLEPGQACLECPSAANCAGGQYPPMAKAGFWGTFVESDFEFFSCPRLGGCREAHLDETMEYGADNAEDVVVYRCADGHYGRLCKQCVDGYWLNGQDCNTCDYDYPNPAYLLVFVMLMMWVPILRVLSFLMPFLYVAIAYLQVLVVISNFNVDWPSAMKDLMTFFGFVNINFSLTRYECFLDQRWEFHIVLYTFIPVLYAIGCFLMFCGPSILGYMRTGELAMIEAGRIDRAVGLFFFVLNAFYIPGMTVALQTFACEKYESGEGTWLRNEPQTACWTGKHQWMVALGAFDLFVYLLLVPGVFAYVLLVRGKTKKLRDRRFLVQFGFLMLRFEDKYYWWELVTIGRKTCFALIRVLAEGDPILQAGMSLFVLTACLVAQFHALPFKKNDYDVLECLCLGSLFFVTFLGLMFNNAEESAMYHPSTTAAQVVGILGVLCGLGGVLVVGFKDILKFYRTFRDDVNKNYHRMSVIGLTLETLAKGLGGVVDDDDENVGGGGGTGENADGMKGDRESGVDSSGSETRGAAIQCGQRGAAEQPSNGLSRREIWLQTMKGAHTHTHTGTPPPGPRTMSGPLKTRNHERPPEMESGSRPLTFLARTKPLFQPTSRAATDGDGAVGPPGSPSPPVPASSPVPVHSVSMRPLPAMSSARLSRSVAEDRGAETEKASAPPRSPRPWTPTGLFSPDTALSIEVDVDEETGTSSTSGAPPVSVSVSGTADDAEGQNSRYGGLDRIRFTSDPSLQQARKYLQTRYGSVPNLMKSPGPQQ